MPTERLGARRVRGPLSIVLAAVALLVTLLLTGCGSEQSAAAEQKAFTAVIDVRTPAEFAETRVEGAVNIDVESSDFASRIAALDPAGTYLVYCRSGNRSATATAAMTSAGLKATDGGGLQDMKNAGYPFTS